VITLTSDGRCRAFEEWPFHPEQALRPPEDTLYDGELVDFKLHDVRDAPSNELGEHCGGVWMSGRGETRRLNVAVTTRAPRRTRAAADAIAAAGIPVQVTGPHGSALAPRVPCQEEHRPCRSQPHTVSSRFWRRLSGSAASTIWAMWQPAD
jgi:hypothetical protein